jgi:CRISPR-associated endonuclease/helicase Cas3
MAGFYAHTLRDRPLQEWEPLEVHLREVAALAAQFAEPFAAQRWAELLGLWHDLGKYNPAFQDYLKTACPESDQHRLDVAGRVDHSTFGAQVANRHGPLGRILAYCIAGHHAGLPDDTGGDAALCHRLERKFDIQPPAVLLQQPFLTPPPLKRGDTARSGAFAIGFFTRMLFSCLVDADFLATEAFMNAEQSAKRPTANQSPHELLERLNAFLAEKQQQAAKSPSAVNEQRQRVLAACRERAELPPGFFSLNVPTGGGKTLSSLAFALTHAVRHGLRRVVYAIPFTSIIEQTADVFRLALGDSAVLEHHSNLPIDDPARQSETSRLAAENFDASLVVTTNVQLFESLFASRTSHCRKLHRLARSVIILDEAQTLPANLLEPTLAALAELVRNYGCTIVFCTATLPAIEWRDDFPIGVKDVIPIIDDPHKLQAEMRRVHVEAVGTLDDTALARRLADEQQVLCIVNTRRHAAELYQQLARKGERCLHLSANMCAAHRSDVVDKIRERLRKGASCRVVSTAVIEAGVDVDFPIVYRAAAGLDSIAQAAGRCNREGRLTGFDGKPRLGSVVVFEYDEQLHRPPPFTRTAAGHFREVLPDHAGDLLSPAAIEAYFQLHYWQIGGDNGHGWDEGMEKRSIMDLLAAEAGKLHYQFREAAEAYRLIDDAQDSVLVPYKQGRNLIRRLQQMSEPPGREFDRAAQRYVVGVRKADIKRLEENQVLSNRHERYYLADDLAYDDALGVVFHEIGLDVEMLIL